MRRAVYAGSFDPPHRGHLDVVRRALLVTDELVVAIGWNSAKKGLLTVAERREVLQLTIDGLAGVRVVDFEGLAVDLAAREGASFLLRGVRDGRDLDAEMAMAQTNRDLAPDVETLWLPASPEFRHYSSSLLREIAGCGRGIEPFVAPAAWPRLREILAARS